jgi:hypothetical protein
MMKRGHLGSTNSPQQKSSYRVRTRAFQIRNFDVMAYCTVCDVILFKKIRHMCDDTLCMVSSFVV